MTLDQKSNNIGTATAQQNHAKAAEHFDAASKAHKEAAKHSEAGDQKQAGYYAAVAQGHTVQANEHNEIACKKIANAAPAMK
jgi:hypothetical protein